MIFSANSFPVDLNRNSTIRANNKNNTDTATMSRKGAAVTVSRSTATELLERYVSCGSLVCTMSREAAQIQFQQESEKPQLKGNFKPG